MEVRVSKKELEKSRSYTSCGFSISYVYDAAGTKLEKSAGGSVTLYAGNYIYQNGALQFFSHAEGYASPNGQGGYDYVYQYRDHMGNVRLSYTDANNDGDIVTSEIVEESNYYPFGLKHQGYNNNVSSFGNSNAQRWKYQGQELNEDFGLNVYEFKYRMHDPAIGRFWQVDPLAEDYAYNSTYAFQENKLGIGIELEGLEVSRHEWLDDNGRNNIRYDANIKVFNNSSASINDVIDYANGFAGQIENDFSGTDSDGNIVSTSVSLEFVAEVDPENDYYIEFTDKVIDPDTGKAATAEGRANVIGDAEVNRMQVLIPGKSGASYGEPVTEDRLPYTGAHEYGHTVGLDHQVGSSNKSPGGRTVGPNNLMRSSNSVIRQRGGVNGGQLSVLQNTVNTPFMVNFRQQMRQSQQQFEKTMKKILNPKL